MKLLRRMLACVIGVATAIALGVPGVALGAGKIQVAPGLHAQVEPYSVTGKAKPTELHICKDIAELVVIDGGVLFVNLNAWVIPPNAANPVRSLACDANGEFVLLQGKKLFRVRHGLRKGEREELGQVPDGDLHVAVTGDGAVWLGGTLRTGQGVLLRNAAGQGWTPVASFKAPVHAIASAGTTALAAIVDDQLILWRAGQATPVAPLGKGYDSVTMDGLGRLYVSGPNGVARLGASKKFEPVVLGVHGPIDANRLTLYVAPDVGHVLVAASP